MRPSRSFRSQIAEVDAKHDNLPGSAPSPWGISTGSLPVPLGGGGPFHKSNSAILVPTHVGRKECLRCVTTVYTMSGPGLPRSRTSFGTHRWSRLSAGHGSKSFLLSLSAATVPCAAMTECRWAGKGLRPPHDIRAQRAGMIPCLSSQSFIRLRKLNDSRHLWVGNHQIPQMDEVLRRHTHL